MKKLKVDQLKAPTKMKSKLQKAARGLNDVVVPEAGDTGNALSTGLSMAGTGAEVAGPWGAIVGGAVGLGIGFVNQNKQDELRADILEKNRQARINRGFAAVDESIVQKEQVYAKGSHGIKRKKIVEVEGKEHHFDHQLNHKGKYKGPSHHKGGIVTTVEEGDVIIPKKHEKTVDTALKTGDLQKIEKIRKTLPKDTKNNKAALGLNDPFLSRDKPISKLKSRYDKKVHNANASNRYGKFGKFKEAEESLLKGDGNSRVLASDPLYNSPGQVLSYNDPNNPKGKPSYYKYKQDNIPIASKDSLIPTPGLLPASLAKTTPGTYDYSKDATTTSSAVADEAKEKVGVGNLLKYANVANNVIRGLQTPKSPEESYLDPELLKYTDRSETARKSSRQLQAIQTSNARNASGGLVGNLRANQAAANADNLDRQDQINEREISRADAVDNTNVQIKNNAKQINLGRKDAYQDQLMRGTASQENYQNAALKEVSDLANINEQVGYQKARDAKLDQRDQQDLAIRNSVTRYAGSFNGDKVGINFKSNNTGGSLNPEGNSKTTNVVAVDKNGKQTTRTTTSTGSKVRSKFGLAFKRK